MAPSAEDVPADEWIRRRDRRLEVAGVVGSGDLGPWPPTYVDPAPAMPVGLVEATPADLDADLLGGAVQHHGCLVVRGLFGPHALARARAALMAAHASSATHRDGGAHDPAWYDPVVTGRRSDAVQRANGAANGSVWLADSPRATAEFMDLLADAGIPELLTDYLGERPVFSLQKSTLRRIDPEERLTTWHQDGAFMGREIRTMNLWVTLTDCGGSFPASGLEVIPTRLDEILDTSDGIVPFAVPFDTVDAIATATPAISPSFSAGDAVFFDEMFLHRTFQRAGLSEPRYALECWFFAPSAFADNYLPVLA